MTMSKPLTLRLKEGALTNYIRRHFGKAGFSGGAIKTSVLEKLAKLKTITGKRARFALIMRRWKW